MDIFFNINNRDILIENGDFALIDNPSVQNGSLLKECRCLNPLSPIFGIGLGEIINSPLSVVDYEMSRWSDMAKKDGAQIAKYSITNANKVTAINIEISY
jgi:hypothetical protein